MRSRRLSFSETLCHFESKGCLDKIAATASLTTTCTVFFVCFNVLIVKQMIKQDAYLMNKWKFCRRTLLNGSLETQKTKYKVCHIHQNKTTCFPRLQVMFISHFLSHFLLACLFMKQSS